MEQIKSSLQEELEKMWKLVPENFASKRTKLKKNLLKNHLPFIFSSGPSYYYIIDFSGMPDVSFSFVHNSASQFYNAIPDEFSIAFFLEKIHPDDVAFFYKCEEQVAFFLNGLKSEEMLNYKFCYPLRVRHYSGDYRLVLHQALALSIGSRGGLSHVLNIHTEIDHITKVGSRTMSIIHMNSDKHYLNLDPFNFSLAPIEGVELFSKMERKIVNFVGAGFTSKMIAAELNISIHTVKTHRKNILKKAECSNTPQLIRFCLDRGYV